MTKIVGNDVSKFQGDINWDTYKNNTNFVIIRSSYGNGFIDDKFTRNQQESRRLNIPRGYYHYCYPQLNTPENEAKWFLKVLGELQDGEVLCLDDEENLPGIDRVAWCKKFLDYVFAQTKVKPLIYLNQSLLQNNNWKPVVDAGYGLWVAAYTENPDNNNFVTGAWKFAAMQQWTSSQKVPGIPSPRVDGNVFFGDVNTFKKYGFNKPVPVDPCLDVKNQLDQMTKERDTYKTKFEQTLQELGKSQNKLTSIKNIIG